jgi:FKBP-type peptidyl-prolyl cis-trans isomerase
MKLRSLTMALLAAGLTAGSVMAQTSIPPAPTAKPATPAPAARPAAQQGQQQQIPPPVDKATMSYAVGVAMARQTMGSGIDLDQAQMMRGIQDALAKKQTLAYPDEKLGAALARYEYEGYTKAKTEYDKVRNENQSKTNSMLSANKSKPGVITLPSGIQYRVIEPGAGAKPSANNTLEMHYTISVPSGQQIGSTLNSPKAPTGKIADFPVSGIREVLPLMASGSRWEVYLPAEKSLIDNRPVAPGMGLIVEVRLVSVK